MDVEARARRARLAEAIALTEPEVAQYHGGLGRVIEALSRAGYFLSVGGTTPGRVATPRPESCDVPTVSGVWYPSLGTPR
jgi:hypothetical protein